MLTASICSPGDKGGEIKFLVSGFLNMSSRSWAHSHYTILTETGIKEQSGCGEIPVTHCVCHCSTEWHISWHVRTLGNEPRHTALCHGPHLSHTVQQDSPQGTAEEVCRDGPQKALQLCSSQEAGKNAWDLFALPSHGHTKEAAHTEPGREDYKLACLMSACV